MTEAIKPVASGSAVSGKLLGKLDRRGRPHYVAVIAESPNLDGQTFWVDFWIFEVSRWHDGPFRYGYSFSSHDSLEEFELPFTCAPIADGYTKWDGCTQIDISNHCCGAADYRNMMDAVAETLEYAHLKMESSDEAGESWGGP